MAVSISKGRGSVFISYTGKHICCGTSVPLNELKISDIIKLLCYKIVDYIFGGYNGKV